MKETCCGKGVKKMVDRSGRDKNQIYKWWKNGGK
jgi:hypothetical protein